MTKRISNLAISSLAAARAARLGLTVGMALASATPMVWAQFVTTPAQKATAQQVAQAGIALSELSPKAPDNYTVKSGDTLWAISGLFLKSPWRWPELWGMNLQDIRNPHLIYPGQQLYLDKTGGRAVLRSRAAAGGAPTETIRVSPRTRISALPDAAIPTLPPNLIEPFLAEPMIVDEATLLAAPRIVAAPEGRVVLARGDRAYARAANEADLSTAKDAPDQFRVFRNATALKDPNTGLVIAYEAQYIGNAELVRGASVRATATGQDIVPATIDIVASKEEMRVGDRLLPEPKREFLTYTPRAPEKVIEGGRIMSVYGSAVANASQNQIVTINRGKADGVESGHVMAIITNGRNVIDRTDGNKTELKLPDERNGLMMVFRVFDRVSYALILQNNDSVRIGDRFVNPK
jgi:LysM domain